MKPILLALLATLFLSLPARAAIVERRIWIETAINFIKEDMCKDKVKVWRCLFPEQDACEKVMEGVYPACSQSLIPDLPEYIDSPETKEQASKVVKDCMSGELAKKYIMPLSKEKMEDYNVCTGMLARQKPLNPNLQKALDFSKTLTVPHCADGSYFRRCYNLSQKVCEDSLGRQHHDCTMKMDADKVDVKPDESSIEETGKKITDCAITGFRKSLETKPKNQKDKDCQ